MPTKAQIDRYTRSIDPRLDSESEKVIRELRQFFTRFFDRFNSEILAAELANPGSVLSELGETLRPRVFGIAEEAGAVNLISTYQQSFNNVGKHALEYFPLFGYKADLSGVDVDAIAVTRKVFRNELREMINQKLFRPLEQQVTSSFITHKDRAVAVGEIKEVIDSEGILNKRGGQFTNNNIEVLISDSHARFHRIVRDQKAQAAGLNILTYEGPEDRKRRPACKYLQLTAPHGARGFWYRDEVTVNLRPDLFDQPPIVAGGGWNCRHWWSPVSLEFAEGFGFIPDPNRSEPEVTADAI